MNDIKKLKLPEIEYWLRLPAIILYNNLTATVAYALFP